MAVNNCKFFVEMFELINRDYIVVRRYEPGLRGHEILFSRFSKGKEHNMT